MSDLSHPCFIIAEAGVNHNGDVALALALVEAAAAAGADAVKFQTFTAEKLVRPGTGTAPYQQKNAGTRDQLAMLRQLELSADAHRQIAQRCREIGSVEFMSTPFDDMAADLLVALGMQRIKIPSGELTNLPFIAHLTKKNLPLILSTGMGTLEEIAAAVAMVAETRREHGLGELSPGELILLHCTSNYPTALEDVNLRAMLALRDHFKLPVGYSDHTAGTLVPAAAVAMGACVIEKHFTLDRSLPGPDHKASLEPGEFTEMVKQIRLLERCLGDGRKEPRPSELPVRDLVRRSVVAARDIPANQIVVGEDLTLLRPGTGLPPGDLPKIVGRRTLKFIPAGAFLNWEHLSA